MASLYIKDPTVAAQAGRVAARLGVSKTEVVRRGLTALERELPEQPAQETADELVERLRAWRRAHLPGKPTGFVADKAFYDSLNDEDDD